MRNALHVLVRRSYQFTTEGAWNLSRRSQEENTVDLRIDSFCGLKLLYCRLNQPRRIWRNTRMILFWMASFWNPRLARNSGDISQSLRMPCCPRWYSSEEWSDPCGLQGMDEVLGAWSQKSDSRKSAPPKRPELSPLKRTREPGAK